MSGSDPERAAASVEALASGGGLDALYLHYDAMRESDPIHRSQHPQFPDCWFVTRHEDVDAVLRDRRFVQDARNSEVFAGREGPFADMVSRMLIFLPPGGPHERTRSLIYRAFTPRRVEARRPRIEALVGELVDGVARRLARGDECDLLREVFYALPMVVIGELLGADAAEQATLSEIFMSQGHEVADVGSASDEQRKTADQTILRFEDEVRRMIDRHRGARGASSPDGAGDAGILPTLIAATEDGDRLSERELLAAVYILIGAGHETTANLLGNGLGHLLGAHRSQWQRLVADPSLVPSAVEELLRFDTSVQWNQRVANEACRFQGVEMAENDRVIVLLGAANRDPEVFPDPSRLDVARDPNPHLAFGAGLYHCLGVHLARLEMQVALAALVRALPGLTLAEPPRPRRTWMMTGLESLRVRG